MARRQKGLRFAAVQNDAIGPLRRSRRREVMSEIEG
jgi:hypothetical protein